MSGMPTNSVRCLTVFCQDPSSSPFFNRLSFSTDDFFFPRRLAAALYESGIRAIDAIHPPADATGDLSRKFPWDPTRVVFVDYRRICATCHSLGHAGYMMRYITMKMDFPAGFAGAGNLNNREQDSCGTCALYF